MQTKQLKLTTKQLTKLDTLLSMRFGKSDENGKVEMVEMVDLKFPEDVADFITNELLLDDSDDSQFTIRIPKTAFEKFKILVAEELEKNTRAKVKSTLEAQIELNRKNGHGIVGFDDNFKTVELTAKQLNALMSIIEKYDGIEATSKIVGNCLHPLVVNAERSNVLADLILAELGGSNIPSTCEAYYPVRLSDEHGAILSAVINNEIEKREETHETEIETGFYAISTPDVEKTLAYYNGSTWASAIDGSPFTPENVKILGSVSI